MANASLPKDHPINTYDMEGVGESKPLVRRVGIDNVLKICDDLDCTSPEQRKKCFPNNGRVDLCVDCYLIMKKRYPDKSKQQFIVVDDDGDVLYMYDLTDDDILDVYAYDNVSMVGKIVDGIFYFANVGFGTNELNWERPKDYED